MEIIKNTFKNISSWKLYLFLLGSNFLLLFFFKDHLQMPTDAQMSYSPAALSLLRGDGYFVRGAFNTHHPPLFPLFLALIYKISGDWSLHNKFYPIAVVFLQSMSCVFLYQIGKKIAGHRVGVLTAVLFNFYPLFVVLTATRYAWNSMPLFLCIFYFFLYLYFVIPSSKTASFLRGIVLGLACLVWAGASYLWILFAVYEAVRSEAGSRLRRILCGSLLFFGFLIPTLCWSGYIYQKTGQKVFVSSAGAPAALDGLIRHDYSKSRQFKTVLRAKEKWEGGTLNSFSDVVKFYAEEFQNHARDAVDFWIYKASRSWYGTEAETFDSGVIKIQTPYILIGIFGVYVFFKRKIQARYLFLLVAGYFWALTFFALSTVRYMMPVFGMLMIFVAVAVDALFERWGFTSIQFQSKT